MHGLQVCLIKYINVSATFLIMENHEKSWNCVSEFLWEPCIISQFMIFYYSSHNQAVNIDASLRNCKACKSLCYSQIQSRVSTI